ncbi:MAG: LCP family protein [Clostridia bacterium]|nr:LCP family protein [Clostridia bacterium]
MKNKGISRNSFFGRVLVIALLIVLAAGAILAVHKWESKSYGSDEDYVTIATEKERQMIRYNNQWYGLKDNIETVLLIGLDKFGEKSDGEEDNYINNARADFLMLLMIDKHTEEVSVIHINRDTIGEIRVLGVAGQVISTRQAQLTLAYSYGSGGMDSCRNTVNAVSTYFYDLPIDHYIAVTMDAVSILNDAAGGVTLTVMDDFSSEYPGMTPGAEVTLDGEQALTYVRARKGMENPSNVRRMERQRQYLSALYQAVKARSSTDSNFGLETIMKISSYMLSDCNVNQLQEIINFTSDFEVKPIYTIEGESKVGEKFMEFYPDEDKFKALIVSVFYEPVDESEVSPS